MTLSCDVFVIIMCSFDLSFIIIKNNSKQQIAEDTRGRHAAKEKPESLGKT